MRKLIQYILLVVGIVLLVYSVAVPFVDTAEASLSPIAPPGSSFLFRWSMNYQPLTYVGGGILLLSVLLLCIFRKSSSLIGAAPAVLISSGVMLELSCFLQVWESAVAQNRLSNFLSSTIQSYTPLSERLADACLDRIWMILLGFMLVVAGVVAWLSEKRKQKEEPVVEEVLPEEPEIVEEAPVILEREEWRITLLCTVMDIRGDYALVKYDDSGVESEVAIALLPFGIDVGDRLKYENYEFETV